MGLVIGPQSPTLSYNMPGMSGINVGSDFPIGVSGGGSSVSYPMAPISMSPSVEAVTQAAVNTGATTSGTTTPNGGLFQNQQNPIYSPDGTLTNPGFLQKGGGLEIGLGALQTLGNLWNSFQQIKLAKDQFKFQKQAYETNLHNQTTDYNTKLESRAGSAGSFTGRSEADTTAYVKEHSL